ncbi:hypothetical protein KAR91_88175 [Candidatus Pacearchaeota archaeon]|nr:hypothetical protein [Candidatus Pacearchaeota archaeon]
MPVDATGRTGQVIKGVALNTANMSITEYLNYPFNSFAILEGKMLGANASGLYILEGADDDGVAIAASFRISLQSFGSSFLKRLRACYLGIKVVGTMVVKSVDEEGAIQSTTSVASSAAGYETIRAKLGRGAKSRYWAANVANDDGEDFTIDTLQLQIMDTARRVG